MFLFIFSLLFCSVDAQEPKKDAIQAQKADQNMGAGMSQMGIGQQIETGLMQPKKGNIENTEEDPTGEMSNLDGQDQNQAPYSNFTGTRPNPPIKNTQAIQRSAQISNFNGTRPIKKEVIDQGFVEQVAEGIKTAAETVEVIGKKTQQISESGKKLGKMFQGIGKMTKDTFEQLSDLPNLFSEWEY